MVPLTAVKKVGKKAPQKEPSSVVKKAGMMVAL
jgi:hypothetical protein